MKLITTITFLFLSLQLFAATPFAFHCITASDGSCTINNDNAAEMEEVEEGVYAAAAGDFTLLYETNVATQTSYMFIYKNKSLLAQSEGARYMAVATDDGLVGIILVDK